MLLFITVTTYAQITTPGQILRLARATYEQGRLHEIPTQLSDDVIGRMQQKQDKVEAYKILCLTYIYLEEPAKADEAMLNILTTDPYFQINEAVDPAEFVALYKTFRTRPIYRIGVKLGGNYTQPNISELTTVTPISDRSKYSPLFGIQFGAALDIPLSIFNSDHFTFHTDLLYQQKRFEASLREDRGNGLINTFTGIESQSVLSLPLTIEYKLLEKKINPYIALGVGTDYLVNSKITATRERPNQTSVPEKSEALERKKINISGIAAAGVKLPLAGGFVVIEARYIHGFTQVSSPETVYANQELALSYGYADSVFKLSSISLTGSYIFNVFKPKKLSRNK